MQTLKARCVLVGEDFRFGYKQSGNIETLRALGERFGFELAAGFADSGPRRAGQQYGHPRIWYRRARCRGPAGCWVRHSPSKAGRSRAGDRLEADRADAEPGAGE